MNDQKASILFRHNYHTGSAHVNTTWQDNSFTNLSGQPTDNANLAIALTSLQNDISSETTRAEGAEASKVDKITGYALSSNDYTSAEKTKLANLSNYFVGVFASAAALSTAHAAGVDGQYAVVESTGADAVEYIWDTANHLWVAGGTGSVTSVNSQTGAVSLSTDNVGEGSTNLYFTAARAIAAVLTGISFLTGGAVISTDTVLQAIGKLQTQINAFFPAGGLLTGYVSGAGAVSSADTILQGIEKLNGNIALKAPLASPAFTGTPTATTQLPGDNTTNIATTAFVTDALGGVGSSKISYNFYQSTL